MSLCRCLSNQPVPNQTDISSKYENINVSTKVENRKPPKQPFAKNLFLGIFDTDILAFPEILDKSQLESLENKIGSLNDCLNENKSKKVSQEVIENLKESRIFGQTIPSHLGGLALNVTESCKLNETLWSNIQVGTIVKNNSTAYEGICQFGTVNQQKKYLPKIANGEIAAAVGISEVQEGSINSINTTAKLNEEVTHWQLNGAKVLVSIKSGTDGVLIVFARTEIFNSRGHSEEGVTAFLVDTTSNGIEIIPYESDNTYSILKFDNVLIPTENILGTVNNGVPVAVKMIGASRIHDGVAGVTIMHDLLKKVSEHAVNTRQLETLLKDSDLVQEKVANLASVAYAVESMTYLTAGLMDGYEDPDYVLETAIIKVFSAEQCLKSYEECIHIFGAHSFFINHEYEKNMKEIIKHQLLTESNDSLKLYIALTGLQHSGVVLNNSIGKLRNPLMNPGYALKKMLEQKAHRQDQPKFTLNLSHFVHPTLYAASQCLEYSVLRLQYATEVIMVRNGMDVINKQMELRRLADVAILVYGMVAVVARASRAYCIGLQNSDYEMYLASIFCFSSKDTVRELVKKLDVGSYSTNDSNYIKIAKKVFQSGGPFTSHPIMRNF